MTQRDIFAGCKEVCCLVTNPGKLEIKEWSIYTFQVEGDKYLVGKSNDIISKYILQFLVFYDRISGVRY